MRKWMRDRLQRRKKTPAAPSDQPAPPPLQPAYFDAEQAPDTASEVESNEAENNEAENNESAISAPPPLEPEDRPEPEARPVRTTRSSSPEPPSEAQPAPSQPAARGPAPAGRSRRRRGGRGRGGRGREQAVAQAFAPAAAKGSIPPLPVEAAEEVEAEGQTPEPVAASAPKPPAPAAAAQRPPKGVVVLAIGLPGSGKSSDLKK